MILQMKGIQKSFDGLEVLKDISLHVDKGEVVSIIGPVVRARAPCCAAPLSWKRSMPAVLIIWDRTP